MNEMKLPLPLKFMFILIWMVLVSSGEMPNAGKSLSPTTYRTISPDDARIIAAISTWTQLSFVTSLTTVPLTCNVAVQNTMACKKRRLRRFNLMPQMGSREPQPTVDGSLNTDAETMPLVPKIDDADVDERRGRLALTVWRSHTSTFTMLMTSTNTALTFSVSFACTIMGASFPPPCG